MHAEPGVPGDMEVDLRGGELRVPEQVLRRPDVDAVLDEVRREGVAERVAHLAALDARGTRSGPLHRRRRPVAPVDPTGARVGGVLLRGEQELPPDGPAAPPPELPLQGVRQNGLPSSRGEIRVAQRPDSADLDSKRLHEGPRKNRRPVHVGLALTHRHVMPFQIDIVDAQVERARHPEAAPLHRRGHETVDAPHGAEQVGDLRPREHRRQARRLPDADEPADQGILRAARRVVSADDSGVGGVHPQALGTLQRRRARRSRVGSWQRARGLTHNTVPVTHTPRRRSLPTTRIIKSALRVIGWTLLQALAYLVVFEAGKLAWIEYNGGWRSDLARGGMWWFAFQLFTFSAAIANACLLSETLRSKPLRRAMVWSFALVPVLWLTRPSWTWDPTPLSAVLVLTCSVSAIATRELSGGLALRLRPRTLLRHADSTTKRSA